MLRGRVACKREALDEAQALLDQAARMEPGFHPTFHALGELAFLRGNPFVALAEFQRAIERSPKDALARPRYAEDAAKMRVLIESGAYLEVQKAWEEQQAAKAAGKAASRAEAAPAEPGVEGVRREPGKTVRRRRRGKGAAEGVTEGVAEGAAENEGELPATEAAAEDGAAEATPAAELAEAEAAGLQPGSLE